MKSQVNQIFIYIIAIVIFGLILLYGYKEIRNLTTKSKTVSYIQFKTQLENKIESSKSYGDIKIPTFNIPYGVDEVCIINTEQDPNSTFQSNYPIIADSWPDKNNNLFLLPIIEQNEPLMLDDIVLESNYLCIRPFQGKIKLKMEGLGNKVEISEG